MRQHASDWHQIWQKMKEKQCKVMLWKTNRVSNSLVEILRLNVRPLLWKPETECQDRLVETVDWIFESLVHRRNLNIRQPCEKTECQNNLQQSGA